MGVANKTNIYQLKANLPMAGVCELAGDDREVIQKLTELLYVENPSADSLRITRGSTPPTDIDDRDQVIHFENDSNGRVVAIQTWADGEWTDLVRLTVGETKWFFVNQAPSGWQLCNGQNGTPNLTENDHYEISPGLALHMYRG